MNELINQYVEYYETETLIEYSNSIYKEYLIMENNKESYQNSEENVNKHKSKLIEFIKKIYKAIMNYIKKIIANYKHKKYRDALYELMHDSSHDELVEISKDIETNISLKEYDAKPEVIQQAEIREDVKKTIEKNNREAYLRKLDEKTIDFENNRKAGFKFTIGSSAYSLLKEILTRTVGPTICILNLIIKTKEISFILLLANIVITAILLKKNIDSHNGKIIPDLPNGYDIRDSFIDVDIFMLKCEDSIDEVTKMNHFSREIDKTVGVKIAHPSRKIKKYELSKETDKTFKKINDYYEKKIANSIYMKKINNVNDLNDKETRKELKIAQECAIFSAKYTDIFCKNMEKIKDKCEKLSELVSKYNTDNDVDENLQYNYAVSLHVLKTIKQLSIIQKIGNDAIIASNKIDKGVKKASKELNSKMKG